jgi:hypothetical protein
MDDVPGRVTVDDSPPPTRSTPRFGSYLGVFYVVAIVGVLSWAVLRDTGTTQAFERLRTGMTTTEVAALLGVPRTETADGPRVVQTWRIPDGQTFVVEFEDGKLVSKRRPGDATTR